MKLLRTIFLVFTCLIFWDGKAYSNPITYTNTSSKILVGKQIELLIDKKKQLNEGSVIKAPDFYYQDNSAPVLFLKDKPLWGRFTVVNRSKKPTLYLSIQYPNVSEITYYRLTNEQQLQRIYSSGNTKSFYNRTDKDVNYNIDLKLPSGDSATYYFYISSQHPLDLRMQLMAPEYLSDSNILNVIIMSTYLAVIISILLYNLFLYSATSDKSYLIYVMYLFTLALAQFTLAGWSFKYFWPNFPALNKYSIIWTSGIAGIFAIYFAISFLRTSTYLPRVQKLLVAFIAVYIVALLLTFTSHLYLSYIILNAVGLIAGAMLIYISYTIYKRGYRPALYYLFAWSAFLVGVIILVLRNFGILPSNNFTIYVLYVGSSIEVILLAIALADKINILRKEKETSQVEALRISQENERLVKEQNVLLEKKVAERTDELQQANTQVTSAYKNLKDTQIQLVESEKMASLGQLTAGIAHEINNPINFVKSNIKPLQLDLKDLLDVIGEYEKLHTTEESVIAAQLKKIDALKKKIDLDFVKTEMADLMKGIENGAERTAEIVRGLRTFSRLDESVIKTVNIHEGIDTTLILLRNNVPTYLKIEKNYLAEGVIECFPGKLNQVFMNLLSNAIHAIKTKPNVTTDEKITITTTDVNNNQIQISIKDSGKGMSDEVKQKIFEPFFTTKDVGEGTGLGLAIVFKIIEEHSGKIDVVSEEGRGTEFIITLNHSIPEKANKIR